MPPNAAELTTAEIDRVFGARQLALRYEEAGAVERVESALAWTKLREQPFRERLLLWGHDLLNDATVRRPSISESVEHQGEVEGVLDRLSEQFPRADREGLRQYAQRRGLISTEAAATSTPGTSGHRIPKPPGRVALGLGLLWALLAFGLGRLTGLVGSSPVSLAMGVSPWLAAAVVAVAGAFAGRQYLQRSRLFPRYRSTWVIQDTRGAWFTFTWGYTATVAVASTPWWVAVAWMLLSAGVPLAVPRLRRRLLDSVNATRGLRLEGRELLGKSPKYAKNVFVPPSSDLTSQGPAAPRTLPDALRDGSVCRSVADSADGVRMLAEHADVEETGFAGDVQQVAALILVDVICAATGLSDLRQAAEYGSGIRRLTAEAVALWAGHSFVVADPSCVPRTVGRAVAGWYRDEADAYLEFARRFLPAERVGEALLVAVSVLREGVGGDLAHDVVYRLETLFAAVAKAYRAA